MTRGVVADSRLGPKDGERFRGAIDAIVTYITIKGTRNVNAFRMFENLQRAGFTEDEVKNAFWSAMDYGTIGWEEDKSINVVKLGGNGGWY